MAGAKGRSRLLLLLALAAASLLLAAGCGGGGGTTTGTTTGAAGTTAPTTTAASGSPLAKTEYVAQMKTIGKSLSTSLNTLGSATTAAKAATALAQVQVDLRAAADKIAAITPPDAVKVEHANLVKAVRDFADQLSPVITKLKAGTMAALATVSTLTGLTEIQTASTAITKKGFKIGG
jgi:hypothetical protein